MNVEMLSIDSLNPYERNTRRHSEDDVNAIAKSIEKYGFNDPVGVWGDKNTIVEGHGRVLAARKLGITEIPVIHLDHMTDEQRRQYAIMHNKTAELSAWDFDALELELPELNLDEFGIDFGTASGFDESAFGGFIDDLESGEGFKVQKEISKDSVNFTFTFPIQYGDAITEHIRKNGKERIVSAILKEVQNAD